MLVYCKAVSFLSEGLDIFNVAAVAQFYRSATENDLQAEPPAETLFPGCSGGRSGGDLEIEFELEVESSLVVLLVLSELFMATARASALLLELIVLLEIPPLLLLKGIFRFLS